MNNDEYIKKAYPIIGKETRRSEGKIYTHGKREDSSGKKVRRMG